MKLQSSIVAITLALCFLAATGNAARISMSQVASYWKRAGGSTSSCPTAVAVAWAESRGDTKAKGYNSNSVDRGLWQINSYWHRDVSDSCAFDAGCNAKAALRISSGGSRWSPWATYNDGLHHRWMNDARRACGSYDEAEEGIGQDGWTVGLKYKITWDQAEPERKPLSLLREKVRSSNLVNRMDEEIGGGRVYGEYNKGPVKVGGEWNFDEAQQNVGGGRVYGEYNKGPVKVGGEWNFDEAQQNVGGGRVYGEYNKGPVKVGGEWNFDEAQQNVGGFSAYGEYNKGPVKVGGEWNFDEAQQNVGGFSAYGEYNKGPVKVGGEWNFDEGDESIGWYDDRPSHTKPHMPDNNSMGNWINFRL